MRVRPCRRGVRDVPSALREYAQRVGVRGTGRGASGDTATAGPLWRDARGGSLVECTPLAGFTPGIHPGMGGMHPGMGGGMHAGGGHI